jgi:hypothetical protein
MKLGTEKRKKTIMASALVAFGALLLYHGLQQPLAAPVAKKAAATMVTATATPTTPAKARGKDDPHPFVAQLLKPTMNPRLRFDLLAFSETIQYQGSGRDIFAEIEDIPKPLAPGLLADRAAYLPPPPPPPPPPIKLKFWGWASQPGETTRAAFLAQGDTGFLAHEGDVVARRYRVVKIGSASIEVEDLLNNNRQNIPVNF